MFFRLASISLFLLSACANPNVSPHDTITTIVPNPVQSINPLYATDAYSQRIGELVHGSLISISDKLIPEPDFAESFRFLSDTTMEFNLRKGCKFQDGREVTSDDVEKSLRYYTNEKNLSAFAENFKVTSRFEKIDSHRFRFHTSKPAPGLLTDLALLKILDLQHLPKEERPNHIQGIGPYKLVSLDSSQIILRRSVQPCVPSPNVEHLKIKVVRDDLSRFLKLKRGEIDIVLNEMNYRKVEAIAKDTSLPLRVASSDGIAYSYLGLNLSNEKLRDIRVRRALALSLDIPTLIKYKSRGMALPARNLLSDQNYYANLNVPIIERDLEKARMLLDEAGYFNGKNNKPPLTLTLKSTTSLIAMENAKVLAAQMGEAGIKIEHQAFEWGIFYNDVKTGNTELFLLRWVGVTDPRIYFEVFHSGEIGRNNRTRYSNKELDKWIEKGESTMDSKLRKQYYDKVQEIVAADLPYIGLWYNKNEAVYRQELKDVWVHPSGSWKPFIKMRKE